MAQLRATFTLTLTLILILTLIPTLALTLALAQASFDEVSQRLHCVSPALIGSGVAGPVALEVTVNGQQYSGSGLPFSFYPPLILLSTEPSRGTALGGALVRVDFDSAGQTFPFEATRCRFGAAPPIEPLQQTGRWVLCQAPPSYEARATSFEHVLRFDDANLTDGSVRVETAADALVSGGVLRLTDPASSAFLTPYEQIVSGAAGIGSAVMTLRRPYNALYWFEVSVELPAGG